MKLRSVYAPKLILTAQAQFLRGMTRLVEQFSHIDLMDIAGVADTLTRFAQYLRDFSDEVSTGDTLRDIEITKGLQDAAELLDVARTLNISKPLAEAATQIERVALRLTYRTSDLVMPADAVKRTTGKAFAELPKPLDLPRLTPLVRPEDTVDPALDDLKLSAGLRMVESGQYVEGYGDYVTEDYFLKTPQLLETEFLVAVEKALAEGAAAADTLALVYATIFSDTVDTPTDLVRLAPLLAMQDAQAVIDTLLFATTKTLTDTPTVADSARLLATKRTTDLATATDTLTRVATQFRTLLESVGQAETRTFTVGKPLTESASPVDAPKKSFALRFLEGGDYAVTGYFETDDYVVGGVAVGDALTLA